MLKFINTLVYYKNSCIFVKEITTKKNIMTRLQTLENRLARLQDKKDFYVGSEKINGKIYRNPKTARFALTCSLIKREIRNLQNA